MNKRLVAVFLFLSFCADAPSFLGQALREPVLVDEFEESGCELFQSKMDSFFVGITEQPNATGSIVIFGDSASVLRSLEYEAWIRSYTYFRNFPKNRLEVTRRSSRSPRVQFWIVPAGVNHRIPGEEWSLVLPHETRPFIFWQTSDAGCPDNPRDRLAQVLTANPHARTKIVLRGTAPERREAKRELVSEFVNSLGIAKKRLKFYSVAGYRHLGFADYELWIVP